MAVFETKHFSIKEFCEYFNVDYSMISNYRFSIYCEYREALKIFDEDRLRWENDKDYPYPIIPNFEKLVSLVEENQHTFIYHVHSKYPCETECKPLFCYFVYDKLVALSYINNYNRRVGFALEGIKDLQDISNREFSPEEQLSDCFINVKAF